MFMASTRDLNPKRVVATADMLITGATIHEGAQL